MATLLPVTEDQGRERNTPRASLDVRAIWPWHILPLARSQVDGPERLARQVTPASHLMISCTLSDNMTPQEKEKMFQTTPVRLMTCLGTVQKLSKDFLSQ